MGNSSAKQLGSVLEVAARKVSSSDGVIHGVVEGGQHDHLRIRPEQIYWAQECLDEATRDRWMDVYAVVDISGRRSQVHCSLDLPMLPQGYYNCFHIDQSI